MAPVQNIHLDTEIRDWVLLPLLLILLCVGLIRHYVTILINAKNSSSGKSDVSNARNSAVAAYCRHLMQFCQFLTHHSVTARIKKYTTGDKAILKEEIKSDQLAAMADPSMMGNMLKSQLTNIVPQMVMMTIATTFFGGFVVARFPFQLSPKFKGMLQQGVAIDNLDCSYATSMSLFFLCMFALNGVLRLVLGAEAEQSTNMQQMNPAMAMQAQAQPAQDHGKIFKQLSEELEYTLDHHVDVMAHAPSWLVQGR